MTAKNFRIVNAAGSELASAARLIDAAKVALSARLAAGIVATDGSGRRFAIKNGRIPVTVHAARDTEDGDILLVDGEPEVVWSQGTRMRLALCYGPSVHPRAS